MNKNCIICDKEYEAKNWASKTCSNECRLGHNKTRNATAKEKRAVAFICKFCNKEFIRDRERNSFCSRSCASKMHIQIGTYDNWRLRTNDKQGKDLDCIVCSNKFYAEPHELETKKLCGSKECKKTYMSKYMFENNPIKGIKAKQEWKDKQKQTLLKKYGVSNAYMLAKHYTLSKPQKEISDEIIRNTSYTIFTDFGLEKEDKKYKIDIVIQEKKLAIEFNGTYWHCDPRFYKEDYLNKKKLLTAKQIWDYDNKRKEFLEKIGYKVLTIWEYDFMLDKQKVINNIMELINEED
jgi:very-short-patch-repair endonuclease